MENLLPIACFIICIIFFLAIVISTKETEQTEEVEVSFIRFAYVHRKYSSYLQVILTIDNKTFASALPLGDPNNDTPKELCKSLNGIYKVQSTYRTNLIYIKPKLMNMTYILSDGTTLLLEPY